MICCQFVSRDAGGLDIFAKAPPQRAGINSYNREFSSPEEEAQLRATLAQGGVTHVDYKCNRATIFVSDQFHASEPFEFKDS